MVVLLLTIFNGCQKDDPIISQMTDGDQPQEVVTNPMFVGLNDIAFSVENNRLVFETEEEYEKCIEFLSQLGDENFSAFEYEIGFESFNSVYKDDPEKSKVFIDELYKTLLNPEMEIVIGGYLFTEIPQKERTLVSEYLTEEDCILKSSANSTGFEVNWNDDAFRILNGEDDITLKSGCSSAQYNEDSHVVNSYLYPIQDYAYTIGYTTDLNFQQTAIFKSIIAKVKIVQFAFSYSEYPPPYYPSPFAFKMRLESVGKATYDRKNKSQFCDYVNISATEYENSCYVGDKVSWRPFYGSRKVNCYNITMFVGIEMTGGALPPQWNGARYGNTFTLQCNPYDSHCICY